MKKSIIALLLIISMLSTTFTGFSISVFATENNIISEIESFPEIISEEEIRENGYVSRATNMENDLYTLAFRNEDGSNTLRVYSHPVKYIDQDGKTRDITLNLKNGENAYVTEANSIITEFPHDLSDGISMRFDNYFINMTPTFGIQNQNSAVYCEDDETVTYVCDESTSIVYALTYAGYKEDIVVNEYTGVTEYSFMLDTDGLQLVSENGSLNLRNSEGVVACLGDVIIFSATERNNTTGTMSYEVIEANEQYLVTINIDSQYLLNADYPIRIDPTVEVNFDYYGAGAIEDVTINEYTTFSGTSGSLFVGRHPAGSLSRVLMRFPNLDIPVTSPDHVTSAYVEIRDLMCQGNEDITIDCHIYDNSAAAWNESTTTTWNSVGTNYLGAKMDSKLISYGQGNVGSHRYSFNITSAAKAWVSGTQSPSKGIVFKASDSFEDQTGDNIKLWYKTFASYNRSGYKPSLTINYSGGDGWGNYYYNATTIPLNSKLSGGINNTADVDMFKFTAPATAYYRFETLGSLDTVGTLYELNGTTLVQLKNNDDFDYPDNGRNSLIYYKLNAGDVVYWRVRGYGINTGNYTAQVTKAKAYIYGYNYGLGDINTTRDISLQSSYLDDIDFYNQGVNSSYYMYNTTNTETRRLETNHELFVFNGHGNSGLVALPSGNYIFSDDLEEDADIDVFSSNLIALWFSCYSAIGSSSYSSMAEASVNEGSKAAFGYEVSVNDTGAYYFGGYLIEALANGATLNQANAYATAALFTIMPYIEGVSSSPQYNEIFGSGSTRLITDTTFNLDSRIAQLSNSNYSVSSTQGYVLKQVNGINVYVRMINGVQTNELIIEHNGVFLEPSVSFSDVDITTATQLISKHKRSMTRDCELSDSETAIAVSRKILKIDDVVGLYDIFTVENSDNNSVTDIYVDVETGRQYTFSMSHSDIKTTNKVDANADIKLNEVVKTSNNTNIQTETLVINGISTNQVKVTAFENNHGSSVEFSKEDISKSAELVNEINEENIYKYSPLEKETIRDVIRKIIKGDGNIAIVDIYFVEYEMNGLIRNKTVTVNIFTGEQITDLCR